MTGLVIVLILLLGVWVKQNNDAQGGRTRQLAVRAQQVAREGKQAHDALCIFRSGLSDDIARNARNLREARAFVARNPNGALGYTQAQLVALNQKAAKDLKAQRQRRRALSIIVCH